jgi:HSP20 family protein
MATLVRWDPFREIAALQNEMGRFMNVFRGEDGNSETSRSWVPALDVWETENDVVYAFDLPGIPEEKISIEFEDGALTVSAERERTEKVGDDRFYRFERRYGTFSRTIGLPQGVTDGDISADYENGVLEVHVRKPEQKKPRRIQIGANDTATIEGTAQKTVA